MRRWTRVGVTMAALAMGATTLVTPAAIAASGPIPAPKPVAASLAKFDDDPQKAMVAWTTWAKGQPMAYVSVFAGGKVACAIDSRGVSKCIQYDRSGKGYVAKDVIYTYPNKRTQVFRYKGKWVYNQLGADTNPITNSKRFYRYDVWVPWLTAGVPVSTMTDGKGWHVVMATNIDPGDDQSEVTVTKVSADGSRAWFVEQDKKGRADAKEYIVLRPVPNIAIPKASKQEL